MPSGLIITALVGTAMLVPSNAPGSGETFEETVVGAFFDICPAVMARQISLADTETVKKLGFVIAPPASDGAGEHPRFGKQQLIARQMPSGKVAVAGYNKPMCQVIFEGASGEKARDTIKSKLLSLGYSSDAEKGGQRGAASIDAFKKAIQPGAVTHVQLATVRQNGSQPMIVAQAVTFEAPEAGATAR